MKKLIAIVMIVLAIIMVGIVGQSDYENETIEATHTRKIVLP